MLTNFLPCRRALPPDGYSPDLIGTKPQRAPKTQSGPLTEAQIAGLRVSVKYFGELEERMAHLRGVTKMVAEDIYG